MMDKVNVFLQTITPDVLEPKEYVDWNKIEKKVNSLRKEVALLQSIKYAKEPKLELANLLVDFPSILRVLKILIAHTPDEIIFSDGRYINFDKEESYLKSNKDRTKAYKISEIFFDLGLISYLKRIESVRDVVIGVLIGLEPNSRKNRRGKKFETLLFSLIDEVIKKINKERGLNLKIIKQLKIALKEETKKVDFAIKEGERIRVVLEGNFYSTSGSKPSETLPRSYPEIERELREKGIGLIVISDGKGWFRMKNSIKVMLEKLTYCFNIKQAKEGKLKESILEILEGNDKN